jgi:hypothetical protein
MRLWLFLENLPNRASSPKVTACIIEFLSKRPLPLLWINGPDAPCSLPHKAHSHRLSDAACPIRASIEEDMPVQTFGVPGATPRPL